MPRKKVQLRPVVILNLLCKISYNSRISAAAAAAAGTARHRFSAANKHCLHFQKWRHLFACSCLSYKICLKSPCTSISASSAVLAVQGLLRHILTVSWGFWHSRMLKEVFVHLKVSWISVISNSKHGGEPKPMQWYCQSLRWVNSKLWDLCCVKNSVQKWIFSVDRSLYARGNCVCVFGPSCT